MAEISHGFFCFKAKEDVMKATNAGRSGSLFRLVRDPVKLTALLYLREALLQERYEECADMIAIATEFGASQQEIQLLLEDARRRPQL